MKEQRIAKNSLRSLNISSPATASSRIFHEGTMKDDISVVSEPRVLQPALPQTSAGLAWSPLPTPRAALPELHFSFGIACSDPLGQRSADVLFLRSTRLCKPATRCLTFCSWTVYRTHKVSKLATPILQKLMAAVVPPVRADDRAQKHTRLFLPHVLHTTGHLSNFHGVNFKWWDTAMQQVLCLQHR